MLNPQIRQPDCYKTQLKLNVSQCAPHTHTKKISILVEMKVVIILRHHTALVCDELQHLQTPSLLTVGSKGGFWLSRPRTLDKGEILLSLYLSLLQTEGWASSCLHRWVQCCSNGLKEPRVCFAVVQGEKIEQGGSWERGNITSHLQIQVLFVQQGSVQSLCG